MVATLGNTNLEEVRKAEERGSRRIATAGMAPDADTIDVDPTELPRKILEACNLIRNRVVAHCLRMRIEVMELLGAQGRSQTINAHHDEAQIGKRLIVPMRRGEGT